MSKHTTITPDTLVGLLDVPTDQITPAARDWLETTDHITRENDTGRVTRGSEVEVTYQSVDCPDGVHTTYNGYLTGATITPGGRAHLALTPPAVFHDDADTDSDRIVVCSLWDAPDSKQSSALASYGRHAREMSKDVHEVVVHG